MPSGVTGLPPSPKAHLIHSLCEDTSRRALVILPNEALATRLVSDINEFSYHGKKAYLFPARDYSFNSNEGQSREFEQARIKTLCKIINEDYSVIACSAEAALQLTIPADELKKKTKATDAINNGLEPLAKMIMSFPTNGTLEDMANYYTEMDETKKEQKGTC